MAKETHTVNTMIALKLLRDAGDYGCWGSAERQRQDQLEEAAKMAEKELKRSPAGRLYRTARRRADSFRQRMHAIGKTLKHEADSLRAAIQIDGMTPRNVRRLKKIVGKKFKL